MCKRAVCVQARLCIWEVRGLRVFWLGLQLCTGVAPQRAKGQGLPRRECWILLLGNPGKLDFKSSVQVLKQHNAIPEGAKIRTKDGSSA